MSLPLPTLAHPRYQTIWAHAFEQPEQALDFTHRLAREMGWSLATARAAVEEYRRFCFLAVVADHPVTPSGAVDAVWHLHLLYTRDYWEVFCPQALGRPLHHGPTQGGEEQAATFYGQYAQTLRSYAQWFGTPPAALWPCAAVRFQPAVRWRWVFLPGVWVVPKPTWWPALMQWWHRPSSRVGPWPRAAPKLVPPTVVVPSPTHSSNSENSA